MFPVPPSANTLMLPLPAPLHDKLVGFTESQKIAGGESTVTTVEMEQELASDPHTV